MPKTEENLRIDKWLWAVRLYKTRSLATTACKNNQISISGVYVKPSHIVRIGDVVNVKRPPIVRSYEVLGLLAQRESAKVVADFVNDLSDQLIQILKDLQEDKSSFEKLGITYEEKAFYDILVKVRDDHGFPYEDEKCLVLAKKIKELVDDRLQYANWSTSNEIKSLLNMDLTVLLYKNGYPPEWDEEVFEKVMEQAENFKKFNV